MHKHTILLSWGKGNPGANLLREEHTWYGRVNLLSLLQGDCVKKTNVAHETRYWANRIFVMAFELFASDCWLRNVFNKHAFNFNPETGPSPIHYRWFAFQPLIHACTAFTPFARATVGVLQKMMKKLSFAEDNKIVKHQSTRKKIIFKNHFRKTKKYWGPQ